MTKAQIESNENALKALNIFKSKAHLFVAKCMLDAGFSISETNKRGDVYSNFMSIALNTEYEWRSRLNSDIFDNHQGKKQKRVQTSLDPKLNSALELYVRDYSTLLTECMLVSGFNSDDIEFKNKKSELFSLSLESETQRYRHLSSEASKKSSKLLSESFSSYEKTMHNATQIYKSSYFTTYTISEQSKKCIIKVANSSNYIDIIGIDNEFKMSRHGMHPGIRQSVKCLSFRNRDALLMNWFEGETLLNCGKFQTHDFLIIAREIASALATLHASRIIHTNLSTEHIIVNLKSRNVNILSLRLAFNPDSENYHHDSQRNFKFISPEQCETGLNRKIDFRSDLYSLGMVYYFMLAGYLPYESEYYFSMMQLHLGQRVEPLNKVNTSIPKPISQLIMKLLEKTADNRQQSSKGVLYDLDLMISEYKNDKQLSALTFSDHGFVNDFYLPRKLYGRKSESSLLLSSFDKVCNGGFEIVVVTSSGGNGKTFFVEHLYEIVAQRRGIFIRGKYSQSLKNEPYSALVKAITNFCTMVLMGSPELLTYLKERIKLAIKDEGKILTDVIPNLHLIIGEQPPVTPAIGRTAKNQFHYVFFNFIRSICTSHYPLVLLLDDTHWADSDSIELLTMLSNDKVVKYMLFICTYRNDKVTYKKHTLKNVSHCIELFGLDYDDVNTLVSDTLKQSRSDTFPLSALVYEKTKGNIFFIIQMLLQFKEENLLQYSYDECIWKWDTNCLKDLSISNHVIPLLKKKMLKLSNDTLNFLKVLSCIGGEFSLSLLKAITEDVHIIQHTVTEGLIVPTSTKHIRYRFAHDYVHESVYDLIPEDERKATSLFVGKQLWDKTPTNKRFEFLFTVTNLLNFSSELMMDSLEQTHLLQLNFLSGQKAKSSNAFQVALKYFETAIFLLKINHWQEEYRFSLDLFNSTAEVAYCVTNYIFMIRVIDQIINNTISSPLDRVHSYSLQIRAFCEQGMESKAVDVGTHAIRCLGEELELKKIWEIIPDIEKINSIIFQENFDVLSLADIKNEHKIAAMKIFSELVKAFYFIRPEFLPALAIRMMQITLKHGFSSYSSCAFSNFGIINCIHLTKIKEAGQYKKLALQLMEKSTEKQVIPLTYLGIYGILDFWSQHVSFSIKMLMKTYELGRKSGSNDHAFAAIIGYCGNSFLTGGDNLQELYEKMIEINRELPATTIIFASIYTSVEKFLGVQPDEKIKRIMNSESLAQKRRFSYYFQKTMEAYYFYEYESAASLMEVTDSFRIKLYTGTYNYPSFIFYSGLVSLAMLKKDKKRQKWLKIAEDTISTLRQWSEVVPENFQNKLTLLEAEMASATGDEIKAYELFKMAIYLSQKHCFVNEEALANERAGIFFVEMKRKDKACLFFHKSLKLYEEWGAIAKVRQIISVYSEYIDGRKNIRKNETVSLLDCTQSSVGSDITKYP